MNTATPTTSAEEPAGATEVDGDETMRTWEYVDRARADITDRDEQLRERLTDAMAFAVSYGLTHRVTVAAKDAMLALATLPAGAQQGREIIGWQARPRGAIRWNPTLFASMEAALKSNEGTGGDVRPIYNCFDTPFTGTRDERGKLLEKVERSPEMEATLARVFPRADPLGATPAAGERAVEEEHAVTQTMGPVERVETPPLCPAMEKYGCELPLGHNGPHGALLSGRYSTPVFWKNDATPASNAAAPGEHE